MCKEQDCNSCNTRVAYEQAIKGYQFHVQRYQTWVNYYAIFVGALFVALYNIKPSMRNFCLCTPTSPLTWELLLSYLVVVLGWLASVCWLASITGHYNWMLSWTHIVKLRERRFFHGKEPEQYVFVYDSILIDKEKQGKPNLMLPGFISTYKITKLFVKGVIWAWMLLSLFLGACGGLGCYSLIVPILLLLFYCVANNAIFYKTSPRYSSTYLKVVETEDE